MKPESGGKFVSWLQNFANNDDIIESHNAGNATFTLGHNKFSHMSNDEFAAYVKGFARPSEKKEPVSIIDASTKAAATSWDWREHGAVTPVKDQGQCGSCWSFSSTGALEGGVVAVKGGALTSLSEQHLVDCDNRQNGGTDMGCNGGWMDAAFDWAAANGGLCSEAGYPYVSGTTKDEGTCKMSSCGTKYAQPKGHSDVTTKDDGAFIAALNIQPVAVAIQANQPAFQLYKSGVMTGSCGDSLDHGVLAVGYDADSYIVKNSWGASWGESGYIRLGRGESYNRGNGQCGILSGPPSVPAW
jgi:C1A family cysteine protease